VSRTIRKTTQPKVRSAVAVAAQFRNSAGAMGGGKRSRNRRDRQQGKLNIKRQEW